MGGGKGGKGGSGRQQPGQAEYDALYRMGQEGVKWTDIQDDPRLMGYHEQALDAWMAGTREKPSSGGGGGGGGAGLIFGGINSGSQSSGESLEDAQKRQQEEAARIAEENRIAEGRRQRDTLYQQRMDAASSATDFINTQIKQEGDRARLLGLDYNISDEDRSTRINDYFATVWGAGSESKLGDLMREFGTPQGFEGFTVTRGTGGNTGGAIGGEDVVGTTGGMRPQQTALTDEDDILGGTATALG